MQNVVIGWFPPCMALLLLMSLQLSCIRGGTGILNAAVVISYSGRDKITWARRWACAFDIFSRTAAAVRRETMLPGSGYASLICAAEVCLAWIEAEMPLLWWDQWKKQTQPLESEDEKTGAATTTSPPQDELRIFRNLWALTVRYGGPGNQNKGRI